MKYTFFKVKGTERNLPSTRPEHMGSWHYSVCSNFQSRLRFLKEVIRKLHRKVRHNKNILNPFIPDTLLLYPLKIWFHLSKLFKEEKLKTLRINLKITSFLFSKSRLEVFFFICLFVSPRIFENYYAIVKLPHWYEVEIWANNQVVRWAVWPEYYDRTWIYGLIPASILSRLRSIFRSCRDHSADGHYKSIGWFLFNS